MKKHILFPFLFSLAVILLTGCGGNSDNTFQITAYIDNEENVPVDHFMVSYCTVSSGYGGEHYKPLFYDIFSCKNNQVKFSLRSKINSKYFMPASGLRDKITDADSLYLSNPSVNVSSLRLRFTAVHDGKEIAGFWCEVHDPETGEYHQSPELIYADKAFTMKGSYTNKESKYKEIRNCCFEKGWNISYYKYYDEDGWTIIERIVERPKNLSFKLYGYGFREFKNG